MTVLQSLQRLMLRLDRYYTSEGYFPDFALRGFSNVTDFSMLKSQRVVRIFAYEGLTDVSSFRLIHKVEL